MPTNVPIQFTPTPGALPIGWTLDVEGAAALIEKIKRAEVRRGRPYGTGAFRDAAHFQETIVRLIQLCDKHRPFPIAVTHVRLARFLMGYYFGTENLDSADRSLRRCFARYNTTLEAFKCLARQ